MDRQFRKFYAKINQETTKDRELKRCQVAQNILAVSHKPCMVSSFLKCCSNEVFNDDILPKNFLLYFLTRSLTFISYHACMSDHFVIITRYNTLSLIFCPLKWLRRLRLFFVFLPFRTPGLDNFHNVLFLTRLHIF